MAYMIEEKDILDPLQRIIDESAKSNEASIRVEYLEDTLANVDTSSQEALRFTTASGKNIETSLLVGADGSNSRVGDFFQDRPFDKISHDFQQTALIATVNHLKPREEDFYWQKFLPGGPIAFLPINDPYKSSIVWTLPKDLASEIKDKKQDEIVDMLNDCLMVLLIPEYLGLSRK